MKNNRWTEDLYLYRIKPAPPKVDDFQEYIALYLAEKDEKYLGWFLHYYEPRLNTVIMQTVQETAMQGHFADLKQAYAFGIYKALQKYDIATGVPFLIFKEFYVKNEIDAYISTMRQGYSVHSVDEYRTLKKAMALYTKYEYKFDEETITKIAAAIGKSIKDTKEIIRSGIDSTHYTDFYRRYADEDDESTAEDVTVDDTSNPERLFFKRWQAEALFDAYENLDYRERTMVADHLGFCTECYGIYELGKDETGKTVKLLRKSKAYIDLAAEHTLSSPDTAFRIVNGAYEKMMIELAIDEYIHIVELRLKFVDDNSVTYEYCADHNKDWGEIHYTFGEDDYDVVQYVYADKKSDFFFASAGEWIVYNTNRKRFAKHMIIHISQD